MHQQRHVPIIPPENEAVEVPDLDDCSMATFRHDLAQV